MSVATRRIVGAEALARWRHPRFGELGAMTLFSVAERSDYLVQLSDHVQRKAVAAAAAWPEALPTLRLSVNITAADIVRPGFAEQFVALVGEGGFDPGRLTVEVTESGLIEDLGAAGNLLAGFAQGGLRVAIDDFGTGYSSLAYLKALPLDYLKIDKRLVEDISGSPRDQVVVRSVIDMARSLGLEVIAEGVETEEQLSLLAEGRVQPLPGLPVLASGGCGDVGRANDLAVIRAEAGTSGQEVSVGLPEVPAFAGMTVETDRRGHVLPWKKKYVSPSLHASGAGTLVLLVGGGEGKRFNRGFELDQAFRPIDGGCRARAGSFAALDDVGLDRGIGGSGKQQ